MLNKNWISIHGDQHLENKEIYIQEIGPNEIFIYTNIQIFIRNNFFK